MTGRCAGCGAPVDGDVCDARCEQIAADRLKWEGKDPCSTCMEDDDECDWEPATVGDLCARHAEAERDAAAERQYEDFHGSAAPQTIREHQDVAGRAR